jgi:lipid II:glycine glycyltransferase (peptidoglycan interpeptide bridge formation enzyme)
LVEAKEWDKFLAQHPEAHVLQSCSWGTLKTGFGWQVVRVVIGEAGAQVLFRPIPLGFTLAYIPKGPVGEQWEALWPVLDTICRERKAVFLKVEADRWDEPADEKTCLQPEGFQVSQQAIQPRRTLVIDLRLDDESLLGRMKQKTRYNIRLALKKNIKVSPCEDLQMFYRLMQETGGRDGFGIHSIAYYQRAYELFHPRGECELLLAESEGEPLAALMVFAFGQRAWYFYGASSGEQREKMPAYLLQWEAMRWARAHGCVDYDLWGVPDEEETILEANFEHRSDGLWGVYRFKRGFGGRLRRACPAWDKIYHPTLFAFYRLWYSRRGISV